MKPEHRLMLRKVGRGLEGRVFYPNEMRTMDVREGDRNATKEEINKRMGMGLPPRVFKQGEMRTMDVREGEMPMRSLTKEMAGMGIKKRKPLKFKL